ncbi:MAG: mechanosensitive ion channel family protein [Gemmatimonadota bacterium]
MMATLSPVQRRTLLAALVLCAAPAALRGQAAAVDTQVVDTTAAAASAVVVAGDTLARIHVRLGPYAAAERAAAIQGRIEALIRDPLARVDSVRVRPDTLTGALDLEAGGVVLMSVTPADAAAAGAPIEVLAAGLAADFGRTLRARSESLDRRALLLGVLYSILATSALVLLLRFLNAFFPKSYRLLGMWRTTRLPAIRFQGLELVSAERIYTVLLAGARLLRGVLTLLLLYFFVPLVLSFFPWTRGMADQLVGWVVGPFVRVLNASLGFIPDLFAILVIVAVTWWVLKLIRLVFNALENGTIQVAGFYADWAGPTYGIVRFLAVALALVFIWPYLPAHDSPQFKGVAAFLGLLVSFGSAGAVGNIVGGLVMIYMRPFQVGDHVRISDTVGDVVGKTLLATRIRTPKNVDITIPNAMVLGSHIINYSSTARTGGVILHTTITIGYDVPWRKVHETLIAAASATADVWPAPEPFVLQTSLDDFYVAYQLNVYTEHASRMNRLYSALHQNIQDYCAAAGIEIMSPHYGALRDGHQSTIPAGHLPPDYRAPAFRVSAVPAAEHGTARKEKPAAPPHDDRQIGLFS